MVMQRGRDSNVYAVEFKDSGVRISPRRFEVGYPAIPYYRAAPLLHTSRVKGLITKAAGQSQRHLTTSLFRPTGFERTFRLAGT